MWVAGCVTARRRGLRSEHPGITRAMGPSMSWDPWPARSRGRPWEGRSVHRSEKTASRIRFGAFVYTAATLRTGVRMQECTQIGENGLLEPFWGICVHCCDASCDASCVRWHECLNHHGVPAVPPRWPPLAWSGRQNPCERRRCRIGVFAEAATHTNPRGAE